MSLVLREHQTAVIEALREGFKQGHRSQLLYAATGFGKSSPAGTRVIMYDGRVEVVENIKVGDVLLGPDSDTRTAYGTHKSWSPIYKITPVKGESFECNDVHILSLKCTSTRGAGQTYKKGEITNISVADYLKQSNMFKHMMKLWRVGVDFPHKNVFEPYIVGLYLADGNQNHTSGLCCGVIKLPALDYVESKIPVTNRYFDRGAWYYSIPSFKNVAKTLTKDKGRVIPSDYLINSRENRLELLAGLLDGDGHLVKNTVFEISCKDTEFKEQILYLARSLGFAAYATHSKKCIKSTGFTGMYWIITISGDTDLIPTKIPSKQATPRKQKKNHLVTGLTVEYVRDDWVYGFGLDKDHLYLLGDFTVTHNTEVAIALMKATSDNYKNAAMVLDRIVLVDQTSLRLTKYNISHGVYQAGHWKYDRAERLQVCSAQTLERRDDFPKTQLLIIDECHIARKQTSEFIKNNPQIKVIGLTATPFTKGLGELYTNVVSGMSTSELVAKKWLAPLKVFIAKEIDMTGAKKVAGEWSQDVVTERGMKITGDIVGEWIKKTHEVFGRPRKTIVFCSGVAHGADLVEQFAKHGYNFVSISYKDDDEFKKAAIEDFAKPDTEIHGLIATDILTRGFDVPDVMIGVSARPFSKSLSSHVQQMGRVMRPYEGKEFALWLDHSGNYLRFRDDWDEVYEDGVKTLDDRAEKAKKEPTEREKKESKCPACSALWSRHSDTCSACGFVRKRRNDVSSIAGEMVELSSSARVLKDDKQSFYSELMYIAKEKNYNTHWASHKYREKFGVWPKGLNETAVLPTIKTLGWIKHKNIAWAKGKAKASL